MLYKKVDDSNRKSNETHMRLQDALRMIQELNKESLRLQRNN